MHFAMPPRKTSRPPPYALRNSRSSIQSLLRRDRLRLIAIVLLGFISLVWMIRHLFGSGGDAASAVIGSGAPVVIVTTIHPDASPAWVEKIKKNRVDYAKKHGYKTFFPKMDDYELQKAPLSWSKVPAMRHAMTLHPTSTYFWYLDSTALIMNPSLPLTSHLLNPARLESLMIVGEPVVPPDSVIKTFANLKGERIDVVVTQDKEGLCHNSFVVRQGEWAKYFLDAWFDPIYRTYNFQKAEAHALEHIVQWHGTMLAKLALVPQNIMNSYVSGMANPHNGMYKEGDLVANFPDCDKSKEGCPDQMQPFFDMLEEKKMKDSHAL